LFSIEDGYLSLAPNTNPLIRLGIKGHPVYTIKKFSLEIKVFNNYEGLQLWPVGHERPEHIFTYPETLLPKQELRINIQCWEYYGFDKVEISIRDALLTSTEESLLCNPEYMDCQKIILCLPRVENCNG